MTPVDPDLPSAEDTPPEEEAEDDDPALLIDTHRDFLLGIDDSARLGYTVLGVSSMVIGALSVILADLPLFSLKGAGLLIGAWTLSLVLGRFAALGPLEARLRRRVVGYCDDRELDLKALLSEAVENQRYEFLVKIFVRVPRRRPGR